MRSSLANVVSGKPLGDVMNDPRHAPDWRGRPVRRGPIVGQYDEPAWIATLERIAVPGCFILAGVTLFLTFYAFGVDWLAGHLW